jgi:hypothetical protein
MSTVCFSCPGFPVGALTIPPLELRAGELACLHLPYLQSQAEQQRLIRSLTRAGRETPAYAQGRIVWAEPAAAPGGFLPHLFNRQSAVAWLCRAGGVSRREARAISERIGIRQTVQVEQLPPTSRNLLAVEAAWARRAEVLIFTTAGCDFAGIRATFDAVRARRERSTAIHLSYPYVVASPGEEFRPVGPLLDAFAARDPDFPFVQVERCCPREARCFELSDEHVPSVRI